LIAALFDSPARGTRVLDQLHQAIMDGNALLLIRCAREDPQVLKQRLLWQGADGAGVLP